MSVNDRIQVIAPRRVELDVDDQPVLVELGRQPGLLERRR